MAGIVAVPLELGPPVGTDWKVSNTNRREEAENRPIQTIQ
jgi:hypothetical protein